MTRVLMISPSPLVGGAERYALTMALAAKQQGWEVQAAVPMAPGTAEIRAELARAGIPVAALPASDHYAVGKAAPKHVQVIAAARIARLVARSAPDVAHLTLPSPGLGLSAVLGLALVGVPTVVVFQLVPDPAHLGTKAFVYRAMRNRSQSWVAVSENGRRLLARASGADHDEIEVIFNGAPLNGSTAAPSNARAAIRSELTAAGDALLVLSVGRLHRQKGHSDLVAALSGLPRDTHDRHLVIAGEGEEADALRSQARALDVADRVHLLGNRDDVPRLLAAADVFAFPSRFEGLPFSLIEAMAAGRAGGRRRIPGRRRDHPVRAGRHSSSDRRYPCLDLRIGRTPRRSSSPGAPGYRRAGTDGAILRARDDRQDDGAARQRVVTRVRATFTRLRSEVTRQARSHRGGGTARVATHA